MFNKKRIVLIGAFLLSMFLFITFAGGTPQNQAIATRTVTFIDGYNNTELESQTIIVGEDATIPNSPTHEKRVFAGWYLDGNKEEKLNESDFTSITENIRAVALYSSDINANGIPDEEESTHTVTFIDSYTNVVLSTQEILDGMDAQAPSLPTHENVTFLGWSTSFTNVRRNLTVNTTWRTNIDTTVNEPESNTPDANRFTVTFIDGFDNSIILISEIEEGHSASTPEAPFHKGYVFTNWTGDVDNINSDRTIIANYAIDKNENGVADEKETFEVRVEVTNGITSPSTQQVFEGLDATFKITANENYTLDSASLTGPCTLDEKTGVLTVKDIKENTICNIALKEDLNNNGIADEYERTLTFIYNINDNNNLVTKTETIIVKDGTALDMFDTSNYTNTYELNGYSYIFNAWQTEDGSALTLEQFKNIIVKENITFTALYDKNPLNYTLTVTYNFEGQTKTETKQIAYNEAYEIIPEYKEGYIAVPSKIEGVMVIGGASYEVNYISVLPKLELTRDTFDYSKEVNLTINAEAFVNEELFKDNKIVKYCINEVCYESNIENNVFTTTLNINKNGKYEITVEDTFGRFATKEVIIDKIDTNSPVIKVNGITGTTTVTGNDERFTNIPYEIEEENIDIIMYAQGEFNTVEEFEEISVGKITLPNNKGNISVTTDGTYTIYVKDKAGNKTVQVVKVNHTEENYVTNGAITTLKSLDKKIEAKFELNVGKKRRVKINANDGAIIKEVRIAESEDTSHIHNSSNKYDISYFKSGNGTLVLNPSDFQITGYKSVYSIYVKYEVEGKILEEVFYADLI